MNPSTVRAERVRNRVMAQILYVGEKSFTQILLVGATYLGKICAWGTQPWPK